MISARPVATHRADGGCGRSLRWLSSKMAKHRLPPPALISPHKTHLQIRHNLCYSLLGPYDLEARFYLPSHHAVDESAAGKVEDVGIVDPVLDAVLPDVALRDGG